MKLQLLRLSIRFKRFTDVIPDFTAFEYLKGVKKKKRVKMCQYNKILSQITSDIANVSCEKKNRKNSKSKQNTPINQNKIFDFLFLKNQNDNHLIFLQT